MPLGRAGPRRSKLDDVDKRWRRLDGPQPRERRFTFRRSTDCARQASAAFALLTFSRRSRRSAIAMIFDPLPNDFVVEQPSETGAARVRSTLRRHSLL